jgi:hypothetical protein
MGLPLPGIFQPVLVCIHPVHTAGHLSNTTELLTMCGNICQYQGDESYLMEILRVLLNHLPLDHREEHNDLAVCLIPCLVEYFINPRARGPHVVGDAGFNVYRIVGSHDEILALSMLTLEMNHLECWQFTHGCDTYIL